MELLSNFLIRYNEQDIHDVKKDILDTISSKNFFNRK